MADWDDVDRLATALPEVTRALRWDQPTWKVRTKAFAWDRPLRRGDLAALGAGAPPGPILGVSVLDEGEKAALIAEDPGVFFTIPHFDGYAAVLIQLDEIGLDRLAEVLVDGWLARAPARLAQEHAARLRP